MTTGTGERMGRLHHLLIVHILDLWETAHHFMLNPQVHVRLDL